MRRRVIGVALVALAGLLACAGREPAAPRTPEPAERPDPSPPEAPEDGRLPTLGGPARGPAQLVLVSVSGLAPHHYRSASPDDAVMPALARLAQAGVSAQGVDPVAPPLSYPAHTTFVTGRTPSDHGIPSDLRLGARGVRIEPYWHASHVKVATLWQRAAERRLRVAGIGWPGTVGAAIDLLLPEIYPIRRGETGPALLETTATPWLFELATKYGGDAPEASFAGPSRDALRTRIACDVLASETPADFVMLSLSQTAPVLLANGPHSREAREAFARIDAELDSFFDCLDDSERLASTAIVVTGDAVAHPVHTLIEPNVALEDAGLVLGAPTGEAAILRWDAYARSNGGSAFVYAKGADEALLARRALLELADETLAFRVVSAEEMLALGADPEAWFGLAALPGYAFGNRESGPLVHASQVRGIAGYLSDTPSNRTGFVAWGRGLRSRIDVPLMRQTDIAPTLARLLGVELEASDGRVLVGILALPSDGSVAGAPLGR